MTMCVEVPNLGPIENVHILGSSFVSLPCLLRFPSNVLGILLTVFSMTYFDINNNQMSGQNCISKEVSRG